MVRSIAVMTLALVTIGFVFGATAQTNRGAESITLDGGNRGEVPFPHRAHQTRQEDCMVCHGLFAQEKGSIEKAKADGELTKKQVMNKLCIQCHRAARDAGKPSGPTTCSKCHVKG